MRMTNYEFWKIINLMGSLGCNSVPTMTNKIKFLFLGFIKLWWKLKCKALISCLPYSSGREKTVLSQWKDGGF